MSYDNGPRLRNGWVVEKIGIEKRDWFCEIGGRKTRCGMEEDETAEGRKGV